MKPILVSRLHFISLSFLIMPHLFAADAAWNVDGAGSWTTAGSWNPATAPGSTVTTNSIDIATFNKNLTVGRAVTVDTNRNIGTITFDHSDAFAYTFSTAGNIVLSNGGIIQSAATNGNHQDAVVTRIDIQGDGGSASFSSNGTSSSSLLTIGNSASFGATSSVQGVSTAGNTTTLNLSGTSVGTGITNGTTNSIVGRIQNGSAGGKLAIVKSGAGTWRITGDNTYSGGTTTSSGILNVGRLTALGTGPVTNNATLELATGGGTITGLTTGLSGNGAVNLLAVSMGSASTNTTLTSLAGTYSGFTGTWNIGTGAAAGAGRATMNGASVSGSSVNVATHATVIVTAATTHNASLTLNGGDTGESFGQLRLEGGAIWAGGVSLAGNITGPGDGNIGANTGQSGTISGVISESGGPRSLTKVGAGTISLAGTSNNSYTGVTNVLGGALNIQHAGALGTTANGTVVSSGGRVELQGGISVSGEAISLSGNGGNFFGSLQSKSGSNNWSGNVTIAADQTRIGAATGSTLELSGAIDSGANVFNVTFRPQDPTSTVIVSGANSYIGSTSIIGGVVRASSLNKVVGGSSSSNFGAPVTVAAGTIAIGAGAAGTLRYTGTGETTDRVIDLAGTTFGATLDQSGTNLLKFTSDLTATGLGSKTLTLHTSSAGSGEISGAIVDNSVTNTTGVIKTGNGTWNLSGNNSYTGTTTVNAGKLVIVGSISTSITSVNTGGTLSGTGTVGTLNINSGGSLAIGNSPGTLNLVGDMTLAAGSISDFEINAFTSGGFDLALASLAGIQTVNFSGGTLNLLFQSGFNTEGSVKIFDFDIYAGTGFTTVNATGLASGYAATFDAANGIVTVVPEPAAAVLGSFGLLSLFRRRTSFLPAFDLNESSNV